MPINSSEVKKLHRLPHNYSSSRHYAVHLEAGRLAITPTSTQHFLYLIAEKTTLTKNRFDVLATWRLVKWVVLCLVIYRVISVNNMDLNSKVALVTGGGIRVGRALVIALAKAGCDVFIHYGNSASPAAEVKAKVESLGSRAITYSADLSDPAATDTVIPKAVEAFGKVDILINSASIFPGEDQFNQIDVALWDEIFAINLRAPFQLSQAFASQIPPDGQGKIININDARIPHPQPNNFAYRLTKRGLWDMTEMLALELAPRITVNAVALGQILEPPDAPDPQKFMEDFAQNNIPLKIPGNTQVVTDSVLFLLAQDFLTGSTIRLDGGEYI
jgi:NAD(P)-dependent dehydrogenase (short-subunit alcohol dehydrogenase family)